MTEGALPDPFCKAKLWLVPGPENLYIEIACKVQGWATVCWLFLRQTAQICPNCTDEGEHSPFCHYGKNQEKYLNGPIRSIHSRWFSRLFNYVRISIFIPFTYFTYMHFPFKLSHRTSMLHTSLPWTPFHHFCWLDEMNRNSVIECPSWGAQGCK